MNRKQRRAAPKQSRPAGNPAHQMFAEAARLQHENKLADATRAFKRLLLLKPDHAEAHNSLGVVLLAQGKHAEASSHFAQALTLMPQLFDQYNGVCETLAAVLPPIGEAMRRAVAAWPNLLTADQLLGSAGLRTVCDDPLLLCMLQSIAGRNFALELVLTSLRAALLADSGAPQDDAVLAFGCALAKQCFINEYVFAATADEDAQVARLKATLGDAIAADGIVDPMRLAVLAMYMPLHALPGAEGLLTRSSPPALAEVVTLQLREPLQELALRDTIPRLTDIDDHVSLRVQRQYEENPYPRWVRVAGAIEPVAIDQYLREMFPAAPLAALGKTADLDYLVAGCGTGWHATGIAQKFIGARLLAVDLSIRSLSYAKRNTPPLNTRIEYAQADILKLRSIGRSFDVIDASGVLHHMADPLEGWRILLSLLRPSGVMHLGFYSTLGRADLTAARAYIAEHGYASTPADIRRCRQDLLKTPLGKVTRFNDFFSTSECRDLLFHVQETTMTIPAIRDFITANGLRFIGFEFAPPAMQQFRSLFSANGWSMSDLDKWHAIETQHPNTFSAMYQIWLQKQ
jgi:SAM-dependent methyltransferase